MSKRVDVEWTDAMRKALVIINNEYDRLWDQMEDSPERDELLWRLERASDGLQGVRYTV